MFACFINQGNFSKPVGRTTAQQFYRPQESAEAVSFLFLKLLLQ